MKQLMFVFLLIMAVSSLFAQSEFTKSGFVVVSLKTNGLLDESSSPQLNIANPFNHTKPVPLRITDVGYEARFYTFGPTAAGLTIMGRDYFFLLTPNDTAQVELIPSNGETASVIYEGPRGWVFEHSRQLPAYVYQINVAFDPPSRGARSTKEWIENSLDHLDEVVDRTGNPLDMADLAREFAVRNYLYLRKADYVDFAKLERYYKLNIESDSSAHEQKPLEWDLLYYERLVDHSLLDTSALLATTYHAFMSSLLKEPRLDLPDILEVTARTYADTLKERFATHVGREDNLFYDMAVATAYVTQLNDMEPLRDGQKDDIERYFTNPSLSEYILRQNEKTLQYLSRHGGAGAHFLAGAEKGAELMEKVLSPHKGKVVLVDFWATWCGPCIRAFSLTKGMKEHFTESGQVAFVYITDESSNIASWHDYIESLGGTHHYLYRDQMQGLYELYGFDAIPTYLLFDGAGKLIEKITGASDLADLWNKIDRML